MLAKVKSYALIGLTGLPVDVEVDVSNGLPSFEIVGLPDASVKEAKERVRSAVRNSGKKYPNVKVTVNLAPADVKKEGSYFDLAIAIGILTASNSTDDKFDDSFVLIGELSLDGTLRAVSGLLPMLISAKNNGATKFIVPYENAVEASYVLGTQVYALKSLSDAVELLQGKGEYKAVEPSNYDTTIYESELINDLSFVKGQAFAKRALEVAVAGGHNILFEGPPGAGKSMIAKCIPSIMPKMTFEEALETTKIHSVAGVLRNDEGIIKYRPFMTPHHTASHVAIVGGGSNAMPGVISLAHNGVLYLDEMPEYPRKVLECLRQPLEDRVITVTRAKASVEYPASIMLCGSLNPCPCGNYGSKNKVCKCTISEIRKYRARISEPLLDRIDIHVGVEGVEYDDLVSTNVEESSVEVRKRVEFARKIQNERFRGDSIKTNAEMKEVHIKKYCKLNDECEAIIKSSFETLNLSARARSRIIKVARTIADLAFSEQIMPEHILEAVGYRSNSSRWLR